MLLRPIVLVLALVGLFELSGCRVLNSMPGFYFVRRAIQYQKLNASNGSLEGHETVQNTSAWQPCLDCVQGGAFSISQKITLPDLKVVYKNVNLTIERTNTLGDIWVNFGKNEFELRLAAHTADLRGSCAPHVWVTSEHVPFSIDMSAFDKALNGSNDRETLSRWTVDMVRDVLRDKLDARLESLLIEDFQKRGNAHSLCNQLLHNGKGLYQLYPSVSSKTGH